MEVVDYINLAEKHGAVLIHLNPIALRKAKTVYNFGLPECNRVKFFLVKCTYKINITSSKSSISEVIILCVSDSTSSSSCVCIVDSSSSSADPCLAVISTDLTRHSWIQYSRCVYNSGRK